MTRGQDRRRNRWGDRGGRDDDVWRRANERREREGERREWEDDGMPGGEWGGREARRFGGVREWGDTYREERRVERDAKEPSVVQRARAATEDDLVYGINPVLLALVTGRRGKFVRLFVQERREGGGVGKKMENEMAYDKVMMTAAGMGLDVVRLSKGELNALSGNRPHQGLVLQAGTIEYDELKGLPRVEKGSVNERGFPFCYLVLDEVSDPQNMGALLRSAHFLGADGVIACRRNSCRLSPVVSKASAGAVEVMKLWGVNSMPRFLRTAREDGWRVVGTALGKEAVSLREVVLDCPTLLVMGSEGHGMRKLVKQECDVVARIGGTGAVMSDDLDLEQEPVDSLNVSVAGAVALFQLLGK